MCEVVGGIADNRVTKEIKSCVGCSGVIIQESGSGSTVSVVSNVEGPRRRLYKAVKDTRPLNDQDVDEIMEESLAGEGGGMVAGDGKTGSTRMSLVSQAKLKQCSTSKG